MRVLLSTIGSRGDVQPVVALGVRLKELGQDVRLCALPDFSDWVEGFGIEFTPIGPEVRSTGKASPTPCRSHTRTDAADGRGHRRHPVRRAAARRRGLQGPGGGGALQIALRTVAEQRGIPYVYAAYCPITLPFSHHAPPAWWGDSPKDGPADNNAHWAQDAARWNGS